MALLHGWSTTARATVYALAGGALSLAMVGVPAAILPTPLFARMTPTRPLDLLVLALTVLLSAALAASYAFPAACPLQDGKLAAGGVLNVLAVGCPTCNKLVVLAVGATGAHAYFEPIQPVLGAVGLALLGYALVVRWRAVRLARPVNA